MTPADAIAAIDRQIADHGQAVALRRPPAAQHTGRGFVRGFSPAEIVGLVKLGDRSVIMSATHLGAFGIPREGDEVAIAGQVGRVIGTPEPVHMNDVLVRVAFIARLA